MEKQFFTLNVEIPDGKEIDFEKSTLTNVVFKDIKPTIKWNDMYGGIEINADGEHFIIDAKSPTAVCDWYTAKRYASEPNDAWKLPTINQLKVIAKYFNEIDNVITDNNGFNLVKGFHWSCDEKNDISAWGAHLNDGYTNCGMKSILYYFVRSVRPL